MAHFTNSYLSGGLGEPLVTGFNFLNYPGVSTGQPTWPVREYPPYKGWRIWSGPSGTGRSTYSAFFASTTQTTPETILSVGGTQVDGGSLDAIQAKVDSYEAKYLHSPTAPPSTPFNVGPDGSYTLPDGSRVTPSRPQTPQVSPAYLDEQRIRNQQIADQQAQQARTMEQLQRMGTPAPSYDPTVSTAPPAIMPSKLPLIIGAVAVLGVAGLLWWKFRK